MFLIIIKDRHADKILAIRQKSILPDEFSEFKDYFDSNSIRKHIIVNENTIIEILDSRVEKLDEVDLMYLDLGVV